MSDTAMFDAHHCRRAQARVLSNIGPNGLQRCPRCSWVAVRILVHAEHGIRSNRYRENIFSESFSRALKRFGSDHQTREKRQLLLPPIEGGFMSEAAPPIA